MKKELTHCEVSALGGKARAAKLSKVRRVEIATVASASRLCDCGHSLASHVTDDLLCIVGAKIENTPAVFSEDGDSKPCQCLHFHFQARKPKRIETEKEGA